jgi:LysM domain
VHPRLTTVRLRALTPLIVVVGIAAALFVPRPGEGTRALAPAVSLPVPQEEFRPVVIEAQPRADGAELPTGSRSARAATRWRRNIDAGATEAAAPRPAPASPKRVAGRASVRPPSGPTHVVAAGDTLWTIARRHSASPAAIQRWNTGVEAYKLVSGQRILVPSGSAMRALPSPAAPRPAKAATSRAPRATTPRATPPPARSTIDHVWSLAVRGTITRQFSAAHLGIDIAAPIGTPVRAVAGRDGDLSGLEGQRRRLRRRDSPPGRDAVDLQPQQQGRCSGRSTSCGRRDRRPGGINGLVDRATP